MPCVTFRSSLHLVAGCASAALLGAELPPAPHTYRAISLANEVATGDAGYTEYTDALERDSQEIGRVSEDCNSLQNAVLRVDISPGGRGGRGEAVEWQKPQHECTMHHIGQGQRSRKPSSISRISLFSSCRRWTYWFLHAEGKNCHRNDQVKAGPPPEAAKQRNTESAKRGDMEAREHGPEEVTRQGGAEVAQGKKVGYPGRGRKQDAIFAAVLSAADLYGMWLFFQAHAEPSLDVQMDTSVAAGVEEPDEGALQKEAGMGPFIEELAAILEDSSEQTPRMSMAALVLAFGLVAFSLAASRRSSRQEEADGPPSPFASEEQMEPAEPPPWRNP
ncbi:UNVERIFIED_CONTAM: hypothetical protein HHA_301470 [Hammondia hammondi]|eukprot:XP_008888209.1 hypothetical protein HHA_301470 [Hammondia hammondi]